MIYVFKTDVSSIHKAHCLEPKLNALFPFCQWNFDLEDCDNIFRIDTDIYSLDDISAGLQQLDIVYEELL